MGQLCGAWKIQGCWDWEKERGGRRGNWVRARNESQGTLFTINVCEKGWKMSGKEGRQRGKSFGGGFRMGCNGVCQPPPAFTVEWYKGDRRSLQGLAWIHLQAGCLPARILHFTLGWIIKSFSDWWKTPSAQFETSLGCFKKNILGKHLRKSLSVSERSFPVCQVGTCMLNVLCASRLLLFCPLGLCSLFLPVLCPPHSFSNGTAAL